MHKQKTQNKEFINVFLKLKQQKLILLLNLLSKFLQFGRIWLKKIFVKQLMIMNFYIMACMATFNQTLSFQTYLLFNKQYQLYIKKETIICVLLVSARIPDEQKLLRRIFVDLAKVLNQKLFYQIQQHKLGFGLIPNTTLKLNIRFISNVRTQMKPLEYDLSQFSQFLIYLERQQKILIIAKVKLKIMMIFSIFEYFDKQFYDKQIGNNKNYSLLKAKSAEYFKTYHQKSLQQQIQLGNKEITAPVSLLSLAQKQKNLQKINNKHIADKALQINEKLIILSKFQTQKEYNKSNKTILFNSKTSNSNTNNQSKQIDKKHNNNQFYSNSNINNYDNQIQHQHKCYQNLTNNMKVQFFICQVIIRN